MKIKGEWQDEGELFDFVVNALDEARDEDFAVSFRDEEDSAYGDRGYINIRKKNGQLFRLELHEIIE